MPSWNEMVAGYVVDGYGVYGQSQNHVGVVGVAYGPIASIWGQNYSEGPGVLAICEGRGDGVTARSAGGWEADPSTGTPYRVGTGVRGICTVSTGVHGHSYQWHGVVASTDSNDAPALRAAGRYAGLFQGQVGVIGSLGVSGQKNFYIDHPLDPQNKCLVHTSVESSEMKNVYDGVAELGADGTAWVELDEWFEALNKDIRYQLTAVGGAAPNLHVAEEVSENRFRIAGGEAGMKVCWQVTGTRKDAWAAANPLEVERDKPQEQRGHYVHPELYGAPEAQPIAPGTPMQVAGPLPQPPRGPELPPPSFGAPPGGVLQAETQRQINELRQEIRELRRRRRQR